MSKNPPRITLRLTFDEAETLVEAIQLATKMRQYGYDKGGAVTDDDERLVAKFLNLEIECHGLYGEAIRKSGLYD
jgi:hypothetical protein